MAEKNINPEESSARGDKKSGLSEDAEDMAIRKRVAGNKDAAKIRKAAEKIDRGP